MFENHIFFEMSCERKCGIFFTAVPRMILRKKLSNFDTVYCNFKIYFYIFLFRFFAAKQCTLLFTIFYYRILHIWKRKLQSNGFDQNLPAAVQIETRSTKPISSFLMCEQCVYSIHFKIDCYASYNGILFYIFYMQTNKQKKSKKEPKQNNKKHARLSTMFRTMQQKEFLKSLSGRCIALDREKKTRNVLQPGEQSTFFAYQFKRAIK